MHIHAQTVPSTVCKFALLVVSTGLCLLQLSLLAAENAALRGKLTEQEQASQVAMQDLRSFCIASQEKYSDKDSMAYKELQQQQQQMMSRLSAVSHLPAKLVTALSTPECVLIR